MNKDILLLGYAREGSTRIKNKMIRPFGDTTLFDLYMRKFEEVSKKKHPFSAFAMAIGKSDKTIWNKSRDFGLSIIERSNESLNQGANFSCSRLFDYLQDMEYKYVMWINGCFPFLTTKTIINIGNYFSMHRIEGLHCIKKCNNWFWDKDGYPLNIDANHLGTQNTKLIYESVQVCHIFNRKYLLENNIFWPFKKNNPYLYELEDSIEFLDVDTLSDFKICESIYARKNKTC